MRVTVTTLMLAAVIGAAASCTRSPSEPPAVVTVGDQQRGLAAIERHGCAACHSIPGVQRADPNFTGPPLDNYAERSFIAGVLVNNESNLARWIMSPKEVNPQTAMPDLGVDELDARDIAAYLYSVR